jgi:hypothetical protein
MGPRADGERDQHGKPHQADSALDDESKSDHGCILSPLGGSQLPNIDHLAAARNAADFACRAG